MKYLRPSISFLLTILLLTFTPAANAVDWQKEYCYEGTTCMLLEQNGSTVDLYIRNVFPSDEIVTTMTFTEHGPMENLKTDTKLPFTRVIQGTRPVKVLSYTITDPAKQWNPNITYYWQYGSAEANHDPEELYELPFEKGRRYRCVQAFNGKLTHHGEFSYSVDFVMPVGTPIHAAREGVVVSVEDRFGEGKLTSAYKDKSNYISILHADGTVGRYAHLVKGGVFVKKGQKVKAGDLIAHSGNSGYSDGPHLHFDVMKPLDEIRSATIPFLFRTDYADREEPREGLWYSSSGDPIKKERKPVEPEDVQLCKRLVNHEFRECGNEFPAGQDIFVAVPLSLPGEYQVRVIMQRSGQQPVISDFRTQKTWWYTYTTAKIPGSRNVQGEWMVEVFIEGEKIRELMFRVIPAGELR